MRVVWSPSSLRDVHHIYNYIARFNPRAAEDLARELVAAGDSLTAFPYRGRAVPGTDLREWTLVYPYIVRYRIARSEVRILRVRHGMRRG
ncbi:MAG TPA: type II toxin-antitoxin system RelE/ParE family toxin [Stellaceae bacterium]|nr:type II toxin-antitoxin system RelE/ParE family toxin [Stellaceae bacterium]